MRIGFDARMIDHPGIGRYIKCLLPELIKQAAGDELLLFGDPDKLKDVSRGGNVKIIRWDASIYSVREQMFAFRIAEKLDVFHVPHFNIPVFYRDKMVVTIHDLIYLLFPEATTSPIAKHYARFMIKSALKNAKRIITVSNHTKEDLVKLYGESCSDKLRVIHEACGKEFRILDDKTREADVRCRYRLNDNIILYVGSVKPHKNVETLIKVFSRLKTWGLPHQLVICGRWDKKADRIKEMITGPHIKYLGEIPTEDLIVLYNIADVLVHLSLYEGFGLTVLEAMRCGTPVVVSDTSSIPEVSGDAAFVVPPHNIEQIADIVYNVVSNEVLRTGMIEAGLEHVGKFSWERTAAETLDVYREVAKNSY